jgi:cell division protein FtsL
MAITIKRDGQVIHTDVKEDTHQVELDRLNKIIDRQEKTIQDLNNQIKDLKADIRFYKIHG